jgi:hypothetical protein
MKWLNVDDESIVNLDHIASAEILDMTRSNSSEEMFHVMLYPADGDSEAYAVCKGSRSKCEDYMRALGESVDCKKIIAVGVHQCNCPCGCQNMIREDFMFCDDCSSDDHWDKKGFVALQLKRDAA